MNKISNLIVHQDHHFLLADKPSGIPVQEDQTGDSSLLKILQAYCKHDLYLIHRIDRPVSGAVLFAKTKEAQTAINQQMIDNQFQKTYLAVIPIGDISSTGTLEHELMHNAKLKKSFISEKNENSKNARLNYKVIAKLDKYMILEVNTETGRFHQIRAQLAHIGYPIKGDVKYGARRSNPDRSIGLHAWKVRWHHHKLNQWLDYTIQPPDSDVWKVFNSVYTAESIH